MGSGKTTVGRALAARLDRPFHDSDLALQRRMGLTATQLVERLGDEELHDLEAEVLTTALASSDPSVIATAASVVDDAAIRRVLRDHPVVWLRAPIETLAERFERAPHRPDFGRDPAVLLEDQAAVRDSLYRSVADLVVETGRESPEAIVAHIVDWLRRTTVP